MHKLCEDHGAQTVLRALRFVVYRLRSHELAAPISIEMDLCLHELNQAQLAFEEAYTERLTATAEVNYRDDRVDEAVTTLAAEVLRIVDDDRDDERYVALFPISPREAIASTGGDRQHAFVRRLIDELRRNPRVQALAAHADKLHLRQTELEQALAIRERCFASEGKVNLGLTEALDQACRAYNRSFSRLQLRFADGPLIESMYPPLALVRRRDNDSPAGLA